MPGNENFAETMQRRTVWTSLHRPFGIAAWVAMLTTVVLGDIQYYNLYGFFAGINSNPCATGKAIFGQDQCWGVPLPHFISAVATTGLYAATMTMSFLMPDPGGLDQGDGAFAKKLRTHKTLRWLHFAGMIAQLGLGIVVANGATFGLDRANHYRALQALATVHGVLGLATFGTMTAAAVTMLF